MAQTPSRWSVTERPAFELHYPHLVERIRDEAEVGHRRAPSEQVAEQVGGE